MDFLPYWVCRACAHAQFRLFIFKLVEIILLLYPSPLFFQTMRQRKSSTYAEDHVCSQEVIIIA